MRICMHEEEVLCVASVLRRLAVRVCLHICTGRNFCLNMMKCLGDRLGCQIKIKQVF